MEKLRGKYELILGFITLVVSLSAFKQELSEVNLELGFMNISLSNYFLYCVYGFSLCLYLYIIEHIVRDTKIGSLKIFDYLIYIGFIIFSFILLTPILIIVDIIVFKIYGFFKEKNDDEIEEVFFFFMLAIQFLSILASLFLSKKFIAFRKKIFQDKINDQEIIELESANKLYKDGYYAHSILESFKVLETHLYKKITEKNHRIPRALNEVLGSALKLNIINKDDSETISRLIKMRNGVAHNSEVFFNQSDAYFVLDFVKSLINRNAKQK